MEYEPAQTVRPRRSLLALLLVPVLAFVGGLAAMGWLLVRWGAAAQFLGIAPAAPAVAPQPTTVTVDRTPAPSPAPETLVSPDSQRLVIDPELVRRVNLVEQRVAQLDLQSRSAAGNADRAEALLVAFAARRALDRGVSLGYIEGLLRQRFAPTQPQAVGTIIASAQNPVTLQQLQEDLVDVAPRLTGGSPDQSWWDAFKTELAGMIIVRKTGTPSPLPSERLRRARRSLETGQVTVALAEVLRLPARNNAADWIAKARRYIIARQALDTIETAALLEPRAPQSLHPTPPTQAPAPARAKAG
ncbi:MAG: hypothetical protein JWP15_2403 [Alphaproteobacteria bacterium]|nr:hypothetical protein [Alphaproteobacteria bacterium]